MNKFLKKILHSKSRINIIFFIALLLISAANYTVLSQEIKRILNIRKVMQHQIVGHRIKGLEEFTKDIEYIGYYTDMSITVKNNLREYAHAQYILAPTILEFNNMDHDYILLVCSTPKAAIKKISELKALPIMSNNQGVILARKRK